MRVGSARPAFLLTVFAGGRSCPGRCPWGWLLLPLLFKILFEKFHWEELLQSAPSGEGSRKRKIILYSFR